MTSEHVAEARPVPPELLDEWLQQYRAIADGPHIVSGRVLRALVRRGDELEAPCGVSPEYATQHPNGPEDFDI